MSGKRVIWHAGFGRLLRRRGSPAFEVREEVPLSSQAPRLDYLLLRKQPAPDLDVAGDGAETLRRLWPLLPQATVLEYKSPGRPYRTGDLDRLLAYVHTYYADEETRPGSHRELCAALAVPGITPTLRRDVEDMGLRWADLGDGYRQLAGTVYTIYVLALEQVARAEGDDLLQCLGSGEVATRAARWFWVELMGSKEAEMSIQDMEGYDELVQKLLTTLPVEQRLAGIPAEQRLAGIPAEQRLAGLDREHEVLALPVHLLRALSEEYVATLPPEVQAEVRRRLQRG
jgi:hypothetical protein